MNFDRKENDGGSKGKQNQGERKGTKEEMMEGAQE